MNFRSKTCYILIFGNLIFQVYKLLKIDKIQLEDGILSKVMKSALGKMNSVDQEAESVHLTRRYLKKQGFLEKLHLKMLNDISKYGWDDDPDPMWRNKKSNENDIVERNNKKRKMKINRKHLFLIK